MRKSYLPAFVTACFALGAVPAQALTLGQMDDFEDGTTQGDGSSTCWDSVRTLSLLRTWPTEAPPVLETTSCSSPPLGAKAPEAEWRRSTARSGPVIT